MNDWDGARIETNQVCRLENDRNIIGNLCSRVKDGTHFQLR